jgi:TonB family protein
MLLRPTTLALALAITAPVTAQDAPAAPEDPHDHDGELRDTGEPGEVDLFDQDALGAAAGAEDGPATVESESEERLDRWMDGAIQDDRIGVGIVDGWYHTIGGAMRGAFRTPNMEAVRWEAAGRDPVRAAVAELGRYARRPEPTMDPGGHAPSTIFGPPDPIRSGGGIDDSASPLYAPTTWHRVEVRLVQAPSGAVTSSRVIRSSGSGTLDRAALEAIREAALGAMPPPPTVIGDRSTITSEWAFEVGDVAPRVSQVGVVEDPVTGGVQPYALGRGLTRTRVSLLRVVDAEHPTFDERRAERRARRRAAATDAAATGARTRTADASETSGAGAGASDASASGGSASAPTTTSASR